MTDIEGRVASLAIREWALWVAVARTGIVHYGIRAADRRGRDAGRARKERAEAAAGARREADRRHAESMAALKALIEGQAQTNATLAEATAALGRRRTRRAGRGRVTGRGAATATDTLPDAEFHEWRNPVGRMFRRLDGLRRIAATVIFPSYFPGANPGAAAILIMAMDAPRNDRNRPAAAPWAKMRIAALKTP